METAPFYDTDRYAAMDKWQTVRCAAHLELLEEVARMDRTESWTFDGASSMAGWLVARYGLSHHTATEWVRVSHRLEELPALRAAYGAGRISWDQLRTATRSATPETDDELAAEAPSLSVRDLSKRARQLTLRDVQQVNTDRHINFRFDENSPALFFNGMMPAADGVEFVKTLTRQANKAPAQPGGTYEPFEARCLDALLMLASQQRGADRDPDRATAIIHIPVSALTSDQAGAEFADGTPLLAETSRRLLCDARLQVSLEDGDDVLGVGRMTRKIPPWMARTLHRRDQGCRYPGCGRTRWIHFHHIIHWAHGGRTDFDNLISVCPYHHRLVHEDGWRISGDPSGEVVWVRPGGRPFVPGYRDRQAAQHGVLMLEDALIPDHVRTPEIDDSS